MILRFVGLSRSTFYYNLKNANKEKTYNGGRPVPGYSLTSSGEPVCDDQIKEYILTLIEEAASECYGYRKLAKSLRRTYNLVVNKKKSYRLCKELKVLRPQRIVKPKYPKKIAINRTVTKINTLWEVDIKYGYIVDEDRFFYILSYLDVYDRTIVDHYMGLNCCAKDAVISLKRALMKRDILLHKTPLVIRSDNGPQFTSHLFQLELKDLNIEHERIPCKTPNKNAHIESYHRIMQDELFNRIEFMTYADAYQAVNTFVFNYNNKRLHGSLGDIPPAEYYLQALNGQEKKQAIKL